MKRFFIGNKGVAMTDLNYLIKIDSDTQGIDKAQKEFDSLQDELNQTGSTARTATTAIDKFGNEIADSGKQADNTAQMINTLKSHITKLMGFLGLSVGVKEIIQLSDEFNNLEARLKLATSAGGDFNAAMDSIKDIANTTAVPLSSTADLFGKLTTATKELGYSQSEVTDLTRTISQAMAVSGGSAESMDAAITQLSQGLSSGALQGDELRSVLEQFPRIATALADGMGVSVGEIKKLGSEGKITAEVFGKAFASQADKIASEFAQMPITVQGRLIKIIRFVQVCCLTDSVDK